MQTGIYLIFQKPTTGTVPLTRTVPTTGTVLWYIYYFKIIEFSLFSVLLYIHIVYLILSIYDIFCASLLMDIVILVKYLQV